jgi:hypothetical protein
MIRFVIDFKVTGEYGMNKLYSGVHWTIRKRQADFIHSLVQTTLHNNKVPKKLYTKPVKVTISYNSRLDVDNHSYLSKLIIDGLKGYLIADDTRKYLVELDQEFWNGEGIQVKVQEKNFKYYVKRVTRRSNDR